MGADIHFYVERLEAGEWVAADKWLPNKDKESADDGEPELALDYKDRFYHQRNYDLFAILANVRNGSGFAGCDTGDGFQPIHLPRGLPEDVSALVKAEADRWDGDGHSHSWATVAELLAYDWTRRTRSRGWVDPVTFWKWHGYDWANGEGPESWSGGVSGGGVKHISIEEMEKIAAEANGVRNREGWDAAERWLKEQHASTYVLVEWEQPYYKTARRFLSDTMPRLWQVGKPEQVRCVYWFDN